MQPDAQAETWSSTLCTDSWPLRGGTSINTGQQQCPLHGQLNMTGVVLTMRTAGNVSTEPG